MAPFLITKTKEVSNRTISREGYADSLLGQKRPRGTTVTSASYSDLLKNHLRPAIKSKRRGLLSSGVLLQHDNARSHTARTTVATITDLHFECLPHPPYSPDLAPSDFHKFGPLKEAMGGKKFRF